MRKQFFAFLFATLVATSGAWAQSTHAVADATGGAATAALATDPWEWGPFFQGGVGIGDRSDFQFTSAGVRLGKVITDQHLRGFFRGQFEYAGEIMPYWEAFTPPAGIQAVKYHDPVTGLDTYINEPVGGGNYHGVSITPIILRWDFKPRRRFVPWVQAAGGLIYTTHKFPPDVLVPHGTAGATSVFNFSPQGGGGFHYFVKPKQSITFSANAIHISSASLGDRNPGVNASMQFQIGYTWWK
jgi:lipid A 3-O-deacylase